MRMKSLITYALFMLALLLSATAAANPITRQQAQHNALTFLESKGKGINNPSLRYAPSRAPMAATGSYYVFNIGAGEGYVIASGDDCAPAILGYADTGYIDLDSLPVNMKSWLEEYAQQIQFMQEKGYPPADQPLLSTNYPAISPLLTTRWGQDYPYNRNCPVFFGYSQCLTGCVATAMAQVMYYHRSNSVPQTTATIPAYTCSRTWDFGNGPQQISVDAIPAGAEIDWAAMVDEYNGYETARQEQAVANLMKYCGAAVQMDYADRYSGGSSAYSLAVPDALKAYFNYNQGTTIKDRRYFSTDDEWNDLIYDELRSSRPVYYSGSSSNSGHAFVCDGFDGAGYYHINWGWNGSCNGYFLLNALNPTGNSSSGYNLRQEALINAFPKPSKPIESPIISFADDSVKAVCVQNWDFDGDGELSKAEAALVTTLNEVFKGNPNITSFDELKYFTGLSRIGNQVFQGCTGLTSVTIPNTVTSIGDWAFRNCISLNSIEILGSITEIGMEAFDRTAWYNNQPDGVVYIGHIAYKYKGTMPDGTSIVLKDGTLGIAGSAFQGCNGLTSVTIPNSVTFIGQYAFWNCRSLTTVNIPNSITLIGDGVFRGCYALESITIPNSVTSIGRQAFENCSSLTCLTIPNSVTSIAIGAFRYCYSLTSVTIPNSVTSISGSLFYCCTGLTSIVIPNSVISIDGYAFYGCSGLTSVTIPNSVTSIGNYAFQDCSGLTSVTIPNSVTSIGNYAFQGCSGLTSMTIPNSVTSIGYMVFTGCTALMSIKVESGNPIYDSRNNCNAVIESFTNTLILGCQNTVIPNSVTTIGDYAFTGCSGLTSVTIPNSVTALGTYAFALCTGLTSVNIPNSVTTIGNVAFYGCSSMTNLNIGNSVTSIGSNAFAGCTGLTSVFLPNSVTSIDDGAFQNCSGLKSVTIPNSVTSIGYLAFYGCSSLTNLTIGNSVTSIGYYAFSDCNSLTNVYCYITDLSTVTSRERLFFVYVSDGNFDYSSRTLHVPHGKADAYQADESWYPYFGQIVDDLGQGDVNGDGTVNITDINAVIDVILRDGSTTAADVNHDGTVNISDINAILGYILSGI